MNSPRPCPSFRGCGFQPRSSRPVSVRPRPHRGSLSPFRGCGFQPRLLPLLLALLPLLLPLASPAWQPNSLLVWINGDKGYQGISEIGARFTEATGIPVTVEHPDGAPDKFANAAQSGKGPDIMIWAHDRLGEWADNGLLMPVDPSPAFRANVFPKAWEAFTHRGRLWGFPIAMEATTLIYNRDLISPDQIPADLDGIRALAPALREKGAAPILWDYNNTYFTWGLLAAGGAQIFARTPSGDYDPADVHVDDPSAVEAATVLVSLLRDGLIARSASYSVAEAQMNQGRLAMFISGPFAWENLRKSGIDFGIALVPGLHGQPGRPFVGVLGAMFNRSSPNLDLAQEFLEHWLVTPAGIAAVDAHVPVGAPALRPAYDAMSSDPHVAGLMANVEVGTLMPNIPQMGAFWSAMETALNTLTTFRDAPSTALSSAASRIRGIYL